MIDKRKEKESDLVAQTPTGSDAACLLRGGGGGGCVGRPGGDLGGASTGPGEVPTLPTHHPPPLHVSSHKQHLLGCLNPCFACPL